jgi:hypothetical protein
LKETSSPGMSASCLGLYMVIEFSCSVAAFSVLLG